MKKIGQRKRDDEKLGEKVYKETKEKIAHLNAKNRLPKPLSSTVPSKSTNRIFDFDDSPRIRPSADFLPANFDNLIGPADGERNGLPQLLILPLKILVFVALTFGDFVSLVEE